MENFITPVEDAFYQQLTFKNIGVYTPAQQETLRHSRVIILGLGGVGGMAAMLCARMGIGHITGVDPDIFEVSNLNRQMFAYTDTLGKYKTQSAEKELLRINPYLSHQFLTQEVAPDNVIDLIKGHDVVIDGLDNMFARVCAHRAAKTLGIPSIAMSGSPPQRGWISTFLPTGIEYEEALNLPSKGQILNSSTEKLLQEVKYKRAQYSVSQGAPKEWADDYCQGKASWLITPIRASLLATFSVHAAIEVLTGNSLFAEAPESLLIDLNHEQPIRLAKPGSGFWQAEHF